MPRVPTRRPADHSTNPATASSGLRASAPRPAPASLPPKSRSQRCDTGPLCGLIVLPPLARSAARSQTRGGGPCARSPPHAGAGLVFSRSPRLRGRPGLHQTGPESRGGGGSGLPGPRPPGRGATARPSRSPPVPAERRGSWRRRLLSLRGLQAAAERRAALACALRKAAAAPAPLAEGGRRRAVAALLRYPATGLSAPPTGRAPYPSAQASGLHQRRPPRPGPARAPPLQPASAAGA